ncbi:hypothetical protein ABG067_005952 [Albugo candida]
MRGFLNNLLPLLLASPLIPHANPAPFEFSLRKPSQCSSRDPIQLNLLSNFRQLSDQNATNASAPVSEAAKIGAGVRQKLSKIRGISEKFYQKLIDAVKIYLCDKNVKDGAPDAPNVRFVPPNSAKAYKNSNGDCIRLNVTLSTDDTVRQEYAAGNCEVNPNCYWATINTTTDLDRVPIYSLTESVSPPEGSMTYSDANKHLKKWIQGLAIVILPGVILSVLSLITFILFVMCRYCCNRCGGRQGRVGGYRCAEKLYPILFFILFAGGVIGVAIAALSYQKAMSKAVGDTLDDTSTTMVQMTEWSGRIQSPLIKIRNTVVTSANDISTALAGTDFIEQGTNGLTSGLETFSSNSANRTLPTGCVNATDLICLPCEICTVISVRMSNAAHQIQSNAGSGVAQLKQVRGQLQSKLVTIADKVKVQVDEQVTTLTRLTETIQSTNKNVDDIREEYSKQKAIQQAGVLALFALSLVVIALGLIGILFGITPFRVLVNLIHIAWIIGFVALILTFLLTSVFLTISAVLTDVCQVTLLLGNDWTVAMGDLGKAPNACFRNTSLLDAFNLSSALSFATGGVNFPQGLDVASMLDFSQLDSADREIRNTTADTFPFSAPLNGSIAFLNSYTNQASSGSSCVLHDTFTRPNILTPWVDVNMPQGASPNGSEFLKSRYASQDANCGQSSSAKAFACTQHSSSCDFSTWIQEIYANTSALKRVEMDANAFVDELHANMTSLMTFVGDFKTQIRALDASIASIRVGLESNLLQFVTEFKNAMYCSFVAERYNDIYGDLCGDLVPALTMISLMLFLAGIFTIPVEICLIIALKRLKTRGNTRGMKFK